MRLVVLIDEHHIGEGSGVEGHRVLVSSYGVAERYPIGRPEMPCRTVHHVELAQLHISVSDLQRSVEFYRDMLGLEFLFEVPAQNMAFLQAGSVRIYLGVPEDPEHASHPLAYFRVDGVQEEYQRLIEAGVSKGTPPHRVHSDENAELWMASVLDPDGHAVLLMEERQLR